MKQFRFILPFCFLILSSCATNNVLKESRLDTDRSKNPLLLQGNMLEVDSFNLEIIPPSSGVQFYRDGIVFLASSKNDENMLYDHISFGKIKTYYAGIYEGSLFKYTDFSPSAPFTYPSEAMTFSADYKKMLFTRISETDGKEKIYEARLAAGNNYQAGWSVNKTPVAFCGENHIYTHPALSIDGKVLLFVSDKNGLTNGLDLYVSYAEGSGWTEPENMSDAINSNGNELFPFLDSDKNLFFSSDRTGGYGGYDIYFCKHNGKTWDSPVILTSRINTPEDDMAFTIDKKDSRSAFYTTRDLDNKNHMQLYRITINNIIANRTKDLTDILPGMASHDEKSLAVVPTGVLPDTMNEKKAEPKTGIKTENETKDEPVVRAKDDKKNEALTPATKPTTAITSPAKEPENKGTIIYRVQILSTTSPKGSYLVSINGVDYRTWEYQYKGSNRITVGEFKSIAEATKFQSECRKSGYQQAFIVVFVNNVRSTEQSLSH